MLIIPKELYIGLQIRSANGNIKSADGGKNVALGFASYKNEKNEVQHSALESWRDKDIPRMCYDNTPTVGMSVAGSVSRWSTSNKCIRVEDPRGFQLEISVENFIEIIRDCVLDKGIIQDEMVWGFDNSVKLIKIGSENYDIGLENFNIKTSTTISLKDIKPGYIVRLKNGKIGKYLGAWHIIEDYYTKFVPSIVQHNVNNNISSRRCYLIETEDDIICSPSIVIKKIEKSEEESISSIESYLIEKVKKNIRHLYANYQAEIEAGHSSLSWNNPKKKEIYAKYGLNEFGASLVEDRIPYALAQIVFISKKSLTKDDIKKLVQKDIKEYL